MNKTQRTAQFMISLWLVMTVVPISFGNFEGAAAKFFGVGIWVGVIVGIVAIVEKIVLVSKNKSHAAARKSTSAKNKESASIDVKPTELREDEVDAVKDKFLFDQNIKSLKAELETTSARFCEESTLKPLGNLTYQEASRYFTEFSELLESGCGRREKESRLPTSFERMKEALKVECLNWCNLGGDFDENCELIGRGFIMLSRFLPDELAEKTYKLPDLSNVDARRAYNVASRAANEFSERRMKELNAEWNEFRKKYRTEQIPKSPPLSKASQPQPPALTVVSESETKRATLDPVSSIPTTTFEWNPGIPWMPVCIFGAGIALPIIALMVGTHSPEQTSSRNNSFAEQFAEQIEDGGPPPGFSSENFEKLKNAAKARLEQVPGVKEHQRRLEVLFAGWLSDHEGQPLPDQKVMSGWFQEMQADIRRKLLSSPEFQSLVDRMNHIKKPNEAELAAFESELERLTQQWALSRLDAYEMLNEFDRKYQIWLRGQGATLRSMDQRTESAEGRIRNPSSNKVTPASSSSTDPFTDSQSSSNRLGSKATIPGSNLTVVQTEKFIEDFLSKSIYQYQGYRIELDKIGWDRILDPQRLATDTSLEKSKIAIRRAKESVDTYTKQMNVLIDQIRKEIDYLKLNAVEKAKVKNAFEQGVQAPKQRRDQIWQLERQIVWKHGEIIDLLQRENGNWDVRNGQIFFTSKDKANTYNNYLGSIRSLAAQKEQVRKHGAKSVQANVHRSRSAFDCSSDLAYSRSYDAMLAELSPLEQEKLRVAVLNLFFKAAEEADPFSSDKEDLAIQRFNQWVDGKNAAEVIEMAGKMRDR